jgi:hypothetical protein
VALLLYPWVGDRHGWRVAVATVPPAGHKSGKVPAPDTAEAAVTHGATPHVLKATLRTLNVLKVALSTCPPTAQRESTAECAAGGSGRGAGVALVDKSATSAGDCGGCGTRLPRVWDSPVADEGLADRTGRVAASPPFRPASPTLRSMSPTLGAQRASRSDRNHPRIQQKTALLYKSAATPKRTSVQKCELQAVLSIRNGRAGELSGQRMRLWKPAWYRTVRDTRSPLQLYFPHERRRANCSFRVLASRSDIGPDRPLPGR